MPKAKISPSKPKKNIAAVAKKTSSRSKQPKLYPMWYLWAAVAAIVVIESAIIGLVTVEDLQYGIEVLDVTESVAATRSSVGLLIAPMAQTFSDVNDFYAQAATELIYLLGNDSIGEAQYVLAQTTAFYNSAADEMIALLDVSDFIFSSKGSVAGISIEQ